MLRRASRISALLLLLVGGACATSGDGAPRRDPDVISAEEIGNFVSTNAYEVVQRLRPNWLRGRNQADAPVVYVDGIRMGGVEVLRTLQTNRLSEIRHRGGPEATTLYGTGVGGGTIEVQTRSP